MNTLLEDLGACFSLSEATYFLNNCVCKQMFGANVVKVNKNFMRVHV
jgi:hypothetical protein